MKSPDQLADKLARQWANADTREQRLLQPESWPVELTIRKPSASKIKHNLDDVRKHLEQWRNVSIGEVLYEQINYRDTQDAIETPTLWRLHKPSDWITATGNQDIKTEFQKFAAIFSKTDSLFHSLLIRQRHLISNKDQNEVIQACELVMQLEQGCAIDIPLRALSLAGIDSKFFERNRGLVIKLLDARFDNLISEIGLEEFLGAIKEDDHWLLIADLDDKQLPFKQIRVRDSELTTMPLPGHNLLIVENERCLHQLPKLKNTLAILGAGLNLSWMNATWLTDKKLAYWGDIDTWGLTMLAKARQYQPLISALLMTREIFQQHCSDKAVEEPKTAGNIPPEALTADEKKLFQQLLTSEKGRLEQEFLPAKQVKKTVYNWMNT
ncbi:MAG: hypothetical protein GXP08_16785 [Gammaproteobacteria bacterium]|nr:hypothetical protein [Gammaproteobacteria bacterium]